MLEKKPEELRNLGIAGILAEAFRLLTRTFSRSSRALRLFVCVAFLLPLSCAAIVFSVALNPLLDQLSGDDDSNKSEVLRDVIIYEIAYAVAMMLLWVTFQTTLQYAMARAETSRSVATDASPATVELRTVLRALPRMTWRMMATLLWWLLILISFMVAWTVVFALLIVLVRKSVAAIAAVCVIFVPILVAVVLYLTALWDVSSVASIFQEEKGISAIKEGGRLLKGRRFVAVFLALVFAALVIVIQGGLMGWVTENGAVNIGIRVLVGIIGVAWNALVMVLQVAVEVVLYAVCKAKHGEFIEISALSRRLDEYAHGYLRLGRPPPNINHANAEGVQMV